MPHPTTSKKPIKNSLLNGIPIKIPTTNKRPLRDSERLPKLTKFWQTIARERHTTIMDLRPQVTELVSISTVRMIFSSTFLKMLGLIRTTMRIFSVLSSGERERKGNLGHHFQCSTVMIFSQVVLGKVLEADLVQAHSAVLLSVDQVEFPNQRAQSSRRCNYWLKM